MSEIDYQHPQHPRGLKKNVMAGLAAGDWLVYYQNLLITGSCGSGKSYIACALGHHACLQGHAVRYFRTIKQTQCYYLLEIMDDRYSHHSTLVSSQLPTSEWHASIGYATLADAILDRLMHNAHRIELKSTSLRKKMSRLDSKCTHEVEKTTRNASEKRAFIYYQNECLF